MNAYLYSPWEIMPQAVTICTGDVNIDGTVLAIIAILWLIRTRYLESRPLPGVFQRFRRLHHI